MKKLLASFMIDFRLVAIVAFADWITTRLTIGLNRGPGSNLSDLDSFARFILLYGWALFIGACVAAGACTRLARQSSQEGAAP